MPLGRFSFAADLILGLNMDLRTAVIIDVRSEGEYEMGHVPNSINIPLDAIPARIEEIKQMSPPLVLCCESGARSNAACGYLFKNGVTDLYDGGSWYAVKAHMERQAV